MAEGQWRGSESPYRARPSMRRLPAKPSRWLRFSLWVVLLGNLALVVLLDFRYGLSILLAQLSGMVVSNWWNRRELDELMQKIEDLEAPAWPRSTVEFEALPALNEATDLKMLRAELRHMKMDVEQLRSQVFMDQKVLADSSRMARLAETISQAWDIGGKK